MNITNSKSKDVYIVLVALLCLVLANVYIKSTNKENFSRYYHRGYPYRNFYRYDGYYDWNYWLYYVNPFYPPRYVTLPFEGKYGGVSWYEPWTGGIYNY